MEKPDDGGREDIDIWAEMFRFNLKTMDKTED